MVIIEMNPRVSRSSALASKATGFPIAKIAAKLAVGYRLDEIRNDITRKTPACFEPTIDYVVVKIPNWQFEKFPGAEPMLGTQMKSVGEVMAIGRTFKEALWQGHAQPRNRQGVRLREAIDPTLIRQQLITPTPDRLGYIRFAFEHGWTVEQIHEMTSIDPWFLKQLRELVDFEHGLSRSNAWPRSRASRLLHAKRDGISDAQLGQLSGADASAVRARRKELGVRAVFNRVDTCAAEFESFTPYLYSSYESDCEADPSDRKKGHDSGQRPQPHRPGHRVRLLLLPRVVRAAGIRRRIDHGQLQSRRPSPPITTPATACTSSRSRSKNVLNICDTEKPDGVIVQFGGQTPLNLALPLKAAGVPIIGTDPANIDLAEDRKLFGKLLDDLGIPSPAERHGHQRGRGLRGGAPHRLSRCWCGPATCWADAPW